MIGTPRSGRGSAMPSSGASPTLPSSESAKVAGATVSVRLRDSRKLPPMDVGRFVDLAAAVATCRLADLAPDGLGGST